MQRGRHSLLLYFAKQLVHLSSSEPFEKHCVKLSLVSKPNSYCGSLCPSASQGSSCTYQAAQAWHAHWLRATRTTQTLTAPAQSCERTRSQAARQSHLLQPCLHEAPRGVIQDSKQLQARRFPSACRMFEPNLACAAGVGRWLPMPTGHPGAARDILPASARNH